MALSKSGTSTLRHKLIHSGALRSISVRQVYAIFWSLQSVFLHLVMHILSRVQVFLGMIYAMCCISFDRLDGIGMDYGICTVLLAHQADRISTCSWLICIWSRHASDSLHLVKASCSFKLQVAMGIRQFIAEVNIVKVEETASIKAPHDADEIIGKGWQSARHTLISNLFLFLAYSNHMSPDLNLKLWSPSSQYW